MELRGKVGVVTGGASGIGKSIAAALVAEGMQVVISDIQADRLQATADEIGATAIQTDVSKAEEVEALAQAVKARFGAVHLLCNNAGIGPMGMIKDLTLNDWRWMLNVNLWGVIHGVTSFLPILRENADGGHIVNTASMAGLIPVPGLTAYCTTKYAIVGLSEAMAQDLALEGGKIGVSILCPGPVQTDLGNSTRNRPAELAGGLADVQLEDSVQFQDQAVDWLSSEATAKLVVHAIKHNERYIITHPFMAEPVERRNRVIEEAFRTEAARRAETAE
ncbi:NAD(P)-dependent dehydrogenase (short-subunit alcohol dehydrogenase family) [Sphingobium xanthum]|uniref:SDR family NAD(P)-dependent oxidoreductase n=1 Tax=Sphingobium xanthum TaxID=1387165 RepID=UPI001C8B11DB|nr:SDR family NAD(P)-dependent oxidoreductase [Sphingobium xanthum]